MPGLALRPDPAGKADHAQRHHGPEQQRRRQGQARRHAGLGLALPGLAQVQLQPRHEDEDHHRPPGHAVQGGDHVGGEDGRVIGRKGRAQNAWTQQNAADDLHHHQGRVIVRPEPPPDQIGRAEDDQHGRQIELGRGHAVVHRFPLLRS